MLNDALSELDIEFPCWPDSIIVKLCTTCIVLIYRPSYITQLNAKIAAASVLLSLLEKIR